MQTSIRWIFTTQQMPDDMETVMIAVADDSEPWLGYFDGDEWRDVNSDPLGTRVYAWAVPPEVPQPTQLAVAA